MAEESSVPQVADAQINPSGLICLHSLVVNLHRNVNFDALMTDELKKKYAENMNFHLTFIQYNV